MLVFPVEILPRGDRRQAVVSSRFDRDGSREGRVHLGADILFRRGGRAPFGGDAPGDPSDDDTPNNPKAGLGFPLFFVPPGTRVLATESGTVIRCGPVSSGARVQVLHEAHSVDAANATGYFHLERVRVKLGDRVRAGQVLGVVGSGVLGRGGAGRHLHFERRQRASEARPGRPVDPEPYLALCEHRSGRLLPPAVAGPVVAAAGGLCALAFSALGGRS